MKVDVHVTVNGRPTIWQVEDGERLLDTLRKNGHTEVKEGCGGGECGACTVALNGEIICSCCAFTQQVEGADIVTAAWVAEHNPALIDSLVNHNAVQCGFCTPGVVVAADNLLKKCTCNRHKLGTKEIKDNMEGNICRCTGYIKIIEAIAAAAEEERHEV